MRNTYAAEVYPDRYVYPPVWSYNQNSNMDFLLTILGKIHNDFLEVIYDPTLEVSLINWTALDYFDKFVSFQFKMLDHARVIYVPWRDKFRMIARRTTEVPIKLTAGIHHHMNECHTFECHVVDFKTSRGLNEKKGTVIIGRQLRPYILGYDPKTVQMKLLGPEENSFTRSARCKEKVPEVRMIGLIRTLRSKNRFQLRAEFEPVQQFLIRKPQ